MNLDTFFQIVRKDIFGKLQQGQVRGTEAILAEAARRGLVDKRMIAYILATAYHETAATMQPIYERGKRSYFDKYEPGTKIGRGLGNKVKGDGYLFRGRGFVQLTGRANYQRMSELIKHNLIADPDAALINDIAAEIMFEGMLRAESFRGDFTGKALEDYFNSDKTDWVNARRIINGLDQAVKIAGYAKEFYVALNAAA